MPTLMVSISGIRGIVGDGLDPETIVKYSRAYANFISKGKVVIGRDARKTGEMVSNIVTGTLAAKGIDVVDLGICPTPTVQFNVKALKANGGIAISASHNPNEWNALKLLNSSGQFLTQDEHNLLIEKTNLEQTNYTSWNKVGTRTEFKEGLKNHIDAIMTLDIIDKSKIANKKFKVLVDCVNGAGAFCIPSLLRDLGCEVIELNCEKTGILPRNPEPVPENLNETLKAVKSSNVDLGIVVDPDVDRLVLITDEGKPFVEENTITQIAKFTLSKKRGNVVVNLSTTRAIEDVAKRFDCRVYRSQVGEANVVRKMKEVGAVIGGEGSGGVIYPVLHYGRDALLGIVMTLQHLAEFGKPVSELKKNLPDYTIVKKKINLKNVKPDNILKSLIQKFRDQKINTEDGLRVDFEDHWVHFRKSNTEPIIRIITEADNEADASKMSQKYYEETVNLSKLV